VPGAASPALSRPATVDSGARADTSWCGGVPGRIDEQLIRIVLGSTRRIAELFCSPESQRIRSKGLNKINHFTQEAVYAFRQSNWDGILLHVVNGVLSVVAGFLLVENPAAGALVLTLLIQNLGASIRMLLPKSRLARVPDVSGMSKLKASRSPGRQCRDSTRKKGVLQCVRLENGKVSKEISVNDPSHAFGTRAN